MDQQKIGAFLKELRKEKNITQEQLADEMRVSRRTVSRWETGSNMPDLDILIDLSEYYGVDLKDILNGQRKSEDMDKELKDTVLKAAEYSNDDKEKMNKTLDGILSDNKEDVEKGEWGKLVGILNKSFGA